VVVEIKESVDRMERAVMAASQNKSSHSLLGDCPAATEPVASSSMQSDAKGDNYRLFFGGGGFGVPVVS